MPATKIAKKKPVTKKRNIAKRPANKSKKMGMSEIKNKAEYLGINPGDMNKADLIHSIQMAEGYSPCFGTSGGHCDYSACCFIADCLKS